MPFEILALTSQRGLYPLKERQTGIQIGQPNSTICIASPIETLSCFENS
jgi:hypothetical protein